LAPPGSDKNKLGSCYDFQCSGPKASGEITVYAKFNVNNWTANYQFSGTGSYTTLQIPITERWVNISDTDHTMQ
jgi:hypothetical protein